MSKLKQKNRKKTLTEDTFQIFNTNFRKKTTEQVQA